MRMCTSCKTSALGEALNEFQEGHDQSPKTGENKLLPLARMDSPAGVKYSSRGEVKAKADSGSRNKKKLSITFHSIQIPDELCFKSDIATHTLYYLPEKEASSEKSNKNPGPQGHFQAKWYSIP